MSQFAIGTIVAANYLAHARVLGNSIRKHHPEVKFFALVVGKADEGTEDEPFCRVSLDSLDIRDRNERLFLQTEKEFLASIKPNLILHLLQQGYESVLYLDADMLLLDPIDDIFSEVRSHSITLTPHLRKAHQIPSPICSELSLLLHGIYNGGFIGASDSTEALNFLEWWSDRLRTHCVFDISQGLHYDQRWLDLVVGYVENLGIIHDCSINMAYWNLHEADHGEKVKVAADCRLFHFSGFDINNPDQLTKYHAATRITEGYPSAALVRDYQALLLKAKVEECLDASWTWDYFPNGNSIKCIHRHRYRALKQAGYDLCNPYDTRKYYQWFYGLWFVHKLRCGFARLKRLLKPTRS